jgi:hypothetical protein
MRLRLPDQPFVPKRTEPDYQPSDKFMGGVLETVRLAINREAKKSGIKNKICDAKWVEFVKYWHSLCTLDSGADTMECGDIARDVWNKLEPIAEKAIRDGNRHALGYKDNRDILTNGDTTNPKFPGGKRFNDQKDGRVQRKKVRDFVTSFINYSKQTDIYTIVEHYQEDHTPTKRNFWKRITTTKPGVSFWKRP